MPKAAADLRVPLTLRIVGAWSGPMDIISQLPKGYSITPLHDGVYLSTPDGVLWPIGAVPLDDAFRTMFFDSLTRDALEEEAAAIGREGVIVTLTCDAGSIQSAADAVRHAAAIVGAGGAGVFVDNSGIAHGAADWLDCADDLGPDGGGLFWAFLTIYGDATTAWTLGMHVLGHRDAQITRTGNDQQDDFHLRSFLGYTYRTGVTIRDGDEAGDPYGTTWRIRLIEDRRVQPGTPVHNPFGRYNLEQTGPTPDQRRAAEPLQ